MSKRSFFSFLSSPFTGGDTTTFLDLKYDKETKDEGSSDISQIQLPSEKSLTPTLNIGGGNPEIPMIGIGGAGLRLLNKLVTRVEMYDMKYPVMGVDTDSSDLDLCAKISHKYHIPGSESGTAHQYRIGIIRTKKVRDTLKEEIRSYFRDLDMTHTHEIVFLLMGSGGTGVGAGIEIARILKEIGKRPVPFLVLPTKEEMSRIKFTAAAGLYHFNYAPPDRCLNLTTICIDNELILNSNSKKHYSSVLAAANERIAATIGDIIASTVIESHGYSADLNEFLEIFRDLKGIGTLQYMDIQDPNRPITEILDSKVQNSLSIDVDIYSSTRGYFFISSRKKQLTARDYRSLMAKFGNADVFNKLYETEADEDFVSIRAIFTGIQSSDSVKKLMQFAEDARVAILSKENERRSTGKVNPKIDQLDEEEEIQVRTDEEAVDERAEDYARLRREGDK